MIKPAAQSTEHFILKFLAIALLIGFIYLPGLHGGFVGDDYPNIVENKGIKINHLNFSELYSGWSANNSGALKRPISSVSFALNYFFSGQKINPADMKLTNIGIHILNAFLIFLVSSTLFSTLSKQIPAQKLGFICALAWALHPLQLTSVLYVVQRMNSLSCSFMLAGFLIYLNGRLNLDKPGRIWLMYSGFLSGTVFAALTKENGALLPFLMLVTELTLLRCCVPATQPNTKRQLYTFYGLTAILPALGILGILFIHPNFVLGGYAFRDFNLTERLMTEARALFYYLGLIFYPDNTQLAIFHDDYAASRSLFEPITTLPSILGILLLAGIAGFCVYRKQYPLIGFAIAWFLTAHSMESSIIPLELMFEHRNYMPSFGIVFGFVGSIYLLSQRIRKKVLVDCLYAGLIFSLALATFVRSNIWSSLGSIAYFEVRNHPQSVRAQTTYAKYLESTKGEFAKAYEHFIVAASLHSNDASSLIEGYMALNRVRHSQTIDTNQLSSLPAAYNSPLVLNQAYLDSLEAKLNQEILRRLAEKPNVISTMVVLRMATNCLVDRQEECQAMAENIKAWASAAEANPSYPNKAIMAVITAKVNFNQGHIDLALENMTKAIRHEPESFYYYGEKAYLYVVLNEFDKAEQVLNEVTATHKLPGNDLLEVSRLKEAIANGRLAKAKETQTSPPQT